MLQQRQRRTLLELVSVLRWCLMCVAMHTLEEAHPLKAEGCFTAWNSMANCIRFRV